MPRAAAIRSAVPLTLQSGRVVRLPRRPGKRVKAHPEALAPILEGLGISVISTNQTRRENQTAAAATLRHLMAMHGPNHTTMVLRTIVESEGNARALIDPVIRAVSAVVMAYPAWADRGLAWLEAFDRLPLLEIYSQAKPLKQATDGAGWSFLAGALADRLHPVFETAKPTLADRRAAKLQREADELECKAAARQRANWHKITMGLELIAGASHRHVLNISRKQASQLIAVARVYADRPTIFRAVSWSVLARLASATMPAERRAAIERDIETGKRVTPRSFG